MACYFKSEGVSSIEEFNNSRHYQNWLKKMLRVSHQDEADESKVGRNFCLFAASDELVAFPENIDDRAALLERDCLLQIFRSMRKIKFEDVSNDNDTSLNEDDRAALQEEWRYYIIPELKDRGFDPVLFVYHEDYAKPEGKRLCFHVLCKVKNWNV